MLSLPGVQPGDAAVGVCLTGRVVELARQSGHPPEVGMGVGEPAELGPGAAEAAVDPRATALSSTGCSASNQAIACSASAGDTVVTPGRAGSRSISSRKRLQQPGTGVRDVQVVVEQPAHRRAPVGLAVEVVGQLGGIGPQQVVEEVPPRRVLDEQVGPGQLGQQDPRPARRDAGEAGGGGTAMSGPGCRPPSRRPVREA